jgi:hypothetical protein
VLVMSSEASLLGLGVSGGPLSTPPAPKLHSAALRTSAVRLKRITNTDSVPSASRPPATPVARARGVVVVLYNDVAADYPIARKLEQVGTEV